MPDVTYLRTMAGGVPVVAARAEIDLTTAGQLRAVLLEATGAGHPAVVLDMTRTLLCRPGQRLRPGSAAARPSEQRSRVLPLRSQEPGLQERRSG